LCRVAPARNTRLAALLDQVVAPRAGGFCRLAVAPALSAEKDPAGPVHRDRHTDFALRGPFTVAESCGTALRTALPQVAPGKACGVHRLAVAFLRLCKGEPARSDRLAAPLPQVVAPQACGFERLAAPGQLSSGRDLAGDSIVTQRVFVVRHGRSRHRTSNLGRGRLHSTPHRLASNESLKLARRPHRPAGVPSSAWAALTA
jgi:hypothetical protein